MDIRTIRILLIFVGIILITLSGQHENISITYYYTLQSIAVISLLSGGYVWTKIKNIHWGWMFTMLIWPLGLIILFLLKANVQMQNNEYKQYYEKKASVNYSDLAVIAERYNKRRDYEKTIDLLLPYANNNDNKSESFFNELATAYGKIGSQKRQIKYWKDAYEYHKRAYQFNKDNPINIFNLAMAAAWLKKYPEAEELFMRYLESGHKVQRQLAMELLDEIRATR